MRYMKVLWQQRNTFSILVDVTKRCITRIFSMTSDRKLKYNLCVETPDYTPGQDTAAAIDSYFLLRSCRSVASTHYDEDHALRQNAAQYGAAFTERNWQLFWRPMPLRKVVHKAAVNAAAIFGKEIKLEPSYKMQLSRHLHELWQMSFHRNI